MACNSWKRIAALSSALTAIALSLPCSTAAAARTTNAWYADPGAPDIAGFWRPMRLSGDDVWLVDGKPLPGRDVQGTWLGIPYTPTYLKIYQARQASSLRGKPYGDPHFNCWPRGPVSEYISGDATMAITQTPGRVQQVFQEDSQLIEFWTDGRRIPPMADPSDPDYTPRMNGYSVGHWEGNTLVTETRGIRKELTLGFLAPHSDVTDVVQRITRLDRMHLAVEVVVADRKALAKSLSIHLHYRLDPRGDFEDEFCAENNRNATDKHAYVTTEVVPNRSTTFDLPQD